MAVQIFKPKCLAIVNDRLLEMRFVPMYQVIFIGCRIGVDNNISIHIKFHFQKLYEIDMTFTRQFLIWIRTGRTRFPT
jgi:hypothetical protein